MCRNQSFTEWFISNSLRFYGEPYKDLADLTYAEYIRDTKLSFQIGLQQTFVVYSFLPRDCRDDLSTTGHYLSEKNLR